MMRTPRTIPSVNRKKLVTLNHAGARIDSNVGALSLSGSYIFVANFVQFQLGGGPVWVDIEQVKAVTPAIGGGARLWLGGGDFF